MKFNFWAVHVWKVHVNQDVRELKQGDDDAEDDAK